VAQPCSCLSRPGTISIFFLFTTRLPPISTLLPYTTLFRSEVHGRLYLGKRKAGPEGARSVTSRSYRQRDRELEGERRPPSGQASAIGHTSSMATAVASPPPMHNEATPRWPPVRSEERRVG